MLALYISEVLNQTESLVFSQTNPVPISFPDMTYSDSVPTQIILVDGSGNIAADSGADDSTVVVSLGLLSTGGAIWSTSSWEPITNPNGWQGTLNPTGANLLALFNSRAEMTLAVQVRITDGDGNTRTFLSMPVTLINSMAPVITTIQTGSEALPQDVSTYTVTGLGLPSVPAVLVNVQKPAGGLSIFATVIATSISADGFTVDLSGITDSTGYVLEYQLSIG